MKVTIELKEEAGITNHSLFNARALALAHGRPRHITLHSNAQKCDYNTDVEFMDGTHFTFTGFSWGYGGEGPNGFAQMLQSLDCGDWKEEIYGLPSNLNGYILF